MRDAAVSCMNKLRKLSWFPPLLARVTLATAFLVSGSGKLQHLSKDVDYFKKLVIPLPEIMTPFVAGTEVTCGSLLLAGLFTRAASVPLSVTMAVAILTAKRKDFHSFSELTGVFEFSYLILLSYLLVEGAGKVSVDELIEARRRRKSQGPPRELYKIA